jgi:hypothetical protein
MAMVMFGVVLLGIMRGQYKVQKGLLDHKVIRVYKVLLDQLEQRQQCLGLLDQLVIRVSKVLLDQLEQRQQCLGLLDQLVIRVYKVLLDQLEQRQQCLGLLDQLGLPVPLGQAVFHGQYHQVVVQTMYFPDPA